MRSTLSNQSQRLQLVHVTCKRRLRRNIVPHGENRRNLRVYRVGQHNANALPPQSYNQGPLTRGPFTCQPSCHLAPHAGVRVDPRGLLPRVCALCATCAPRGLVRPCHVALCAASHPRGSRVPRQSPLFATSAPWSCG